MIDDSYKRQLGQTIMLHGWWMILMLLTSMRCYAQPLTITTLDHSIIATTILDSGKASEILKEFSGKQDNALRKEWTARTYTLSNGKILLEFFDRQALLIDRLDDFKQLARVRFVKNSVSFLKKNISYRIELSVEEGQRIVQNQHPKRLEKFKSDMPEYFDFELYALSTGQVLYLDKSANAKNAIIYADLKTLSSESNSIANQVYGSEEDEYLMKKLAGGDRLPDYDIADFMLYPKYLPSLIANHQLKLIQRKVYVNSFYGNLYQSARKYYVLVDEVKQKNGAGNRMQILSLRFYETLQQVRDAQARYNAYKDSGVRSEHFYQRISNRFGEQFPAFVQQLVDSLPAMLNFDRDQLSVDSVGMDLVDESLKWHADNYSYFDTWFPSVLAYYGQCFTKLKHDGRWTMLFDKEYQVWIPEMKLSDGTAAWDWGDFYKSMMEGPIPMRWAGDWDRVIKFIRSKDAQQAD